MGHSCKQRSKYLLNLLNYFENKTCMEYGIFLPLFICPADNRVGNIHRHSYNTWEENDKTTSPASQSLDTSEGSRQYKKK
jgi:hypothetical protein